ncbi:hypothetical protein [Sphingomonas sp.]|uniref:hypothetical protein n=1 Tax=Sphingomonas sp. TaxID=28214 RepID=UPI003B3AA509
MTPLVVTLAAAALLAGCNRSSKPTEPAASTPAATQSSSADPAQSALENGGMANQGDSLIEQNDRAIAENKRLIAQLGRYQSENFEKYEQVRKDCEAKVQGTLADSAAPAVARCIEAGWK